MKKQFYSDYGNIQIIIALLRKYGIKHIVVSAGNRHSPLVHSIENEKNNNVEFFKLYSVVDERSASFFALGLIQQLHEPVAICCTSGTASCNYVSAVQEAFFQQLPLVVITADRNPMYLYQQEEQMAVQQNLFLGACKKSVMLPIVRDEKESWYCARLVNEALLEVVQGTPGPVHINYPVENNYPVNGGFMSFDTENLPDIKKIERLLPTDSDNRWRKWAENLAGKKILVIYGQYRPLSNEEQEIIELFCSNFNCVFSTDLLSNLFCSKSIDCTLLGRTITSIDIEKLLPEVVITMNGNSIASIKSRLPVEEHGIRHIHVSANGAVSDPYKSLPDIVACSPIYFFSRISNYCSSSNCNSYYNLWYEQFKQLQSKGNVFEKNINWSSIYSVQQIMSRIPKNSLIHLANSTSVRLCSLFPIKEGVEVYCNRGTNGIDGSMSAFVGNSMYHNGLSFLFIGDLSFFYDMNALWNRHLTPKMRILVINNGGGAIFYTYPSLANIPTLAENIAAEHSASVKAWAEDRGFMYLSAKNKEELKFCIDTFFDDTLEKKVILEVFTDKENDANMFKQFVDLYTDVSKTMVRGIAKHISPDIKKVIKKVIK